MSAGETVTAQVAWVSPAHYVDVRQRVADARKALEDAATAFDCIVADEAFAGRRNSGAAQTARSGAKAARVAIEATKETPASSSKEHV